MMEPTVTQNSGLYFVQHKIPKRHSGVLVKGFGFLARARRKREAAQPEIRGNVFVWPRIQWQA